MACKEKYNITVIGGTRGLGYWVAKFLKSKNQNVTITSRNRINGEKAAEHIGAKYEQDNIASVKNADVIIFSVPIDIMIETIKEVAPHAPENSLLMDITSIKEEPSEALYEYAPENTSILPCHPMFGPSTPSIDGQVVILTPVKQSPWISKVKKFLEDENTKIVMTTPSEHDKMMSVVQGLTHFSYISIASTIRRLNISVKKSREFASPIYSLMLDMISRIVSQNPYLYYSIQNSNEQTTISRNLLLEESQRLASMIDNNDQENFVKAMSESAKHLNEYEEALSRSDKAINLLTHDFKILKDNIGKEVGLLHQYSKTVHIGIVKSVTADEVNITESNGKDVRLRLSNISILSPVEVYNWKIDNLDKHTFDLSVMFSDNCDKEVLLDIIRNLKVVLSAEIIDVYTGEQIDDGFISLTFRYTVFNKEDKNLVEKYFIGMGGKIR